eukprot:Nitzschia sp. Nitz4//scaffold258_size27474//19321//21045//NITZ4_008187-RA/size27474-processed-gene-0.21-mRNA-1//1//CDS//3329544491//429//frame0
MADSMSFEEEAKMTFLASIRSVGTACTLAAVGIYLHRRGFVVGQGKRTLALISQQVTIPLLFFTKIIYCNQDWSTEPCPDVTKSIADVWVLLVWPAYVVCVGFGIGYVAARLSGTPPHQITAALVAVGFGNSTGIPITLLTVIHENFPSNTKLGRIDPTLFLSVYLLLYPVLQWGIGGWMLAPPAEKSSDEEPPPEEVSIQAMQEGNLSMTVRNTMAIPARNVLNKTPTDFYVRRHRGMGEVDASMYMSVPEGLNTYASQLSLQGMAQGSAPPSPGMPRTDSSDSIGMTLSRENSVVGLSDHVASHGVPVASPEKATEQTSLLKAPSPSRPPRNYSQKTPKTSNSVTIKSGGPDGAKDEKNDSDDDSVEKSIWETIKTVIFRCLQPPVVGALMGLLIASQPSIRGVFVDLVDRDDGAPLEWLFDGLYAVGQAAVPINMIILGCNLSASYNNNAKDGKKGKDEPDKTLFPTRTMMYVVIGKLIAMPIAGFISAWGMYNLVWKDTIPKDIAGAFYLVIMVVFLCPTANNVMVMVELAGSGSKAGMARIIAWQYAVAPVLLSLTVTVAVGLANRWAQ